MGQWRESHPHEELPEFSDERMPWPIRRYRALEIVKVFTWEFWLRVHIAIHEDDQHKAEEDGNPREPFDEEQVRSDWLQWQSETIRRYRLEGLVTVEQENSDHH